MYSSRTNAILLIGAALVSGSNADAAHFTTIVSEEGMSIVLRGDIEFNDRAVLESLLDAMDRHGPSPQKILLDSPGGSLLGGIGLARLIQRRGDLATKVAYGSTCASACFLVFASGREKSADYSSFIGVHGVADKDGRVSNRTEAATLAMARVSEELGVPEAINMKIVTTPPNEIVWLTAEDLKSMGVSMIGRPVQAQRGGSGEPLPQKRDPAMESLNLSQARVRAAQIRQALDAAERAEAERHLGNWSLNRENDDLSN